MYVETPPGGISALNAYLIRAFNRVSDAIKTAKTMVVKGPVKSPGIGQFYLVNVTTDQFTQAGLYYFDGEGFVRLSSAAAANLKLGVLSTDAFYGDKGQEAFLHTQKENNPHKVTAAQVGLGNVNNTGDIDKPISSAVASELQKYVQKTTAINGRPLAGDVLLKTSDLVETFNCRFIDSKDAAILAAEKNSWRVWTPLVRNISIGDGLIEGRYLQVGTAVDFYILLTIGTTTAVTSSVELKLPLGSVARSPFAKMADGICNKASGASQLPLALLQVLPDDWCRIMALEVLNPASPLEVGFVAPAISTYLPGHTYEFTGRYEIPWS